MEVKNLEFGDYLEKRKNGESNYDIFAEIASAQGYIEFFAKLDHNSQKNLIDIFSWDKIVNKLNGADFICAAKTYKAYIDLRTSLFNANNKELEATLQEQIEQVLYDLKTWNLPVTMHEIRREITKRAAIIPTGDEYMDMVRRIMFEQELDEEECNGDFYLMQAKQAQRDGVDKYLSNVSLATLYLASMTKIEKLYKEKKYDRDILDALRDAQSACVCYYASGDVDNEIPARVLKANKLLDEYNCLVTEEEYISNVERAIAQLNGDTVKSPITLS